MERYLILFLCVVGLFAYNNIITLKKKIEKLELRLKQLEQGADYEEVPSYLVSDELRERVARLKREGKVVHAIKEIRRQTQMGLVEAKQYVDRL